MPELTIKPMYPSGYYGNGKPSSMHAHQLTYLDTRNDKLVTLRIDASRDPWGYIRDALEAGHRCVTIAYTK